MQNDEDDDRIIKADDGKWTWFDLSFVLWYFLV